MCRKGDSMSRHVNDGPAASRQFVAQPTFWGSKVCSITTPAWQNNLGKSYAIMVVGILAFCAVLGGLFLGMQSLGYAVAGRRSCRVDAGIRRAALPTRRSCCAFRGVYGWYWWSRRRKIVLSVTSDGLTVNTRPGDVYSFTDTKLGTWGRPAARRWVWRCTCNLANADSFSADETAASPPGHDSMRRTRGTASRSTSTPGCRQQTPRKHSPWSAAAVGWIFDRPDRTSLLAACSLPIR